MRRFAYRSVLPSFDTGGAPQALFERYRIAMGNAATPELVKECLQDTVSEFQTELQSQQRLPAAQLRALNTKLSSLEGSILTAGKPLLE